MRGAGAARTVSSHHDREKCEDQNSKAGEKSELESM